MRAYDWPPPNHSLNKAEAQKYCTNSLCSLSSPSLNSGYKPCYRLTLSPNHSLEWLRIPDHCLPNRCGLVSQLLELLPTLAKTYMLLKRGLCSCHRIEIVSYLPPADHFQSRNTRVCSPSPPKHLWLPPWPDNDSEIIYPLPLDSLPTILLPLPQTGISASCNE